MITFEPKAEVPPALEETEENRFERIRKAAERHRKSDTDGTRPHYTTVIWREVGNQLE
jgi:hypothetical protein